MKLLLVAEQDDSGDGLAGGLESSGHSVTVVRTAVSALAAMAEARYDIAVVCSGGAGSDGPALIHDLRTRSDRLGVLILSRRASTEELVRVLDAGADDYLAHPVDLRELDARIRALSRRLVATPELRHRDLSLDLAANTVYYLGAAVSLTPTECRLMAALLRTGSGIATRQYLRKEVWGLEFDPGTRITDVHISNLRRKLEADNRRRVVVTVPGEGFSLR